MSHDDKDQSSKEENEQAHEWALNRLHTFRWELPDDWKFDREFANSRAADDEEAEGRGGARQ